MFVAAPAPMGCALGTEWLRGSNPHDPPKPPFRRFGSILKGQIALSRK